MSLKTFFLSFLSFVCIAFFIFSSKTYANHIPPPSGYVNDFANVLTSEQKTILENSLSEYQKKTTNEIVVAIVKNLDGGDIDDFTVRVFEEWKIGKKGKDNGILLLVAIEERKLRIEVGYGLEPNLTDGQAGEIIRNVITPEFKKGDYYKGISGGLLAIEQKLSSEPTPENNSYTPPLPSDVFTLMIVLFIIMVNYTGAFLARSKSIWAGGIIGAILGGAVGFLASVGIAIFFLFLFGGLGLLLDLWLSSIYKKRKEKGLNTGWWTSGGGFSSSSGSGFGGFSGGSSGGGGSSGSW